MEQQKGSLKSTIAVSLTNYLDAGSIVAGASGLTLWQNYLGLTETDLGWLNALSANCFGAALGAIIGGRLADRYGRKNIYTYNMLLYMLGVGIILFSCNFPMLLTGFLITGISVGVGVPASWTYISETSEIHNRGRNIGISQFAWSIGPAIIFLLGWLFSPTGPLGDEVRRLGAWILQTQDIAALNLFGNRLIFFTLFIVALIAWLLQRQLNESAEWMELKKQKVVGKRENPYKELFMNMINVKTIVFLVGIYLTWNFVAGAMGFFMPHVYETAGGLSNETANFLQMAMWGLTALFSFTGFALLADKVNQRLLYAFGTTLGVAAWIILTFVGITNTTALWTFVILWGIHAGFGVQAFYALWATELFPARYRAAAQGVMFFIVRGGAAIWSFVFTGVYASAGFYTAGNIMVGLLVIALIVGVAWTPNTRGKALKQISEERYGKDS
ncbi:MAG: MFS transporter [Dysgonamonadaceae bacterium]|jgi:inositol transporter-like SP family MFS transporter|nr:MFS transporter [Dysgonamonadaceae bacterium]